MLRITLYKNCILNNNYRNVICPSAIEDYLNTLQKITFNIDYVYQEKSGRLVFEYNIDTNSIIYNYNYIKIETIESIGEVDIVKIKRYCFIDDIEIKNELVYLTYSEDIFSSYASGISGITESFLSRSRLRFYKDENQSLTKTMQIAKLPVKYDGNNSIMFEKTTLVNNLSLVVQIQFYKTDAQGNFTERYVRNFLVSNQELSSLIPYSLINQREYVDIMEFLISNQSVGFMEKDHDAYRYEVGDFYLFPSDFYNTYKLEVNEEFIRNADSSHKVYLFELPISNMEVRYTKHITTNYKQIAIGTFSTQFEFINNGQDFTYSILISNSGEDFAIHISLLNRIEDITKDFYLTPAIKSLTSEELSLRKMERQTKNTQLTLEMFKKVLDVFLNMFGKRMIAGGETISGMKNNYLSLIGNTVSGYGKNIVNDINAIGDFFDAYGLAAQLTLINSPLYSSQQGVFGNSINFINGINGIMTFYINSVNDDYVKETINNYGHEVFEYIKDLNELYLFDKNAFINNNINYNFVKFDDINVFGSFTQEIANQLNAILNKGIKIWYQNILVEDNYV